jgi:hypothetical protein
MHLARVRALPGGPATHGINNPLARLFMKPATRRLFSKAAPLRLHGTADRVIAPASGIGQRPTEPTSVTRGPGTEKCWRYRLENQPTSSFWDSERGRTCASDGRWGSPASKTRLAFALRGGQAYPDGRSRIEKGNSVFKIRDRVDQRPGSTGIPACASGTIKCKGRSAPAPSIRHDYGRKNKWHP